MCRYAAYGPYKEKWACFKCRKSFRQTSQLELTRPFPTLEDGSRLVTCPQCKSPMHNMGLDFKVPGQTDIKQWRKVELLFEQGSAYHSCGCNGPGPRPARLKDVPTFLEECQKAVTEWQRQQRIQRRADELKVRRKKNRKLLENNRISKMMQYGN